jgi:hypothetical protein
VTSPETFAKDLMTNEQVRNQLRNDPKGFLATHEVTFPPETEVVVLEDTADTRHFVMPKEMTTEMAASDNPVMKVIRHALEDEGYKQRLLADPKAAVAELGINVPDHLTIKVVENSPSTYHVILPLNPNDMELSDADLANVAGGSIAGIAIGGTCAVTAGGMGIAATIFGACSVGVGAVITGLVAGGFAIGSAVGTVIADVVEEAK